ncbi:hypothetical protein HELRODRAFT_106158 [Helobdella robusta]|uniref:Peptidase M14 domain-containing protein n=1 Tax=Helobdella robusta TaxID=6412 RepID=T1EE05_HELRO|nr:hypothetical protein HELRODRAFT_106158 [Helobdella robusta]ESO06514.1 hypothetical protein HELRODRAFT_106158 [Helobdella robusta]
MATRIILNYIALYLFIFLYNYYCIRADHMKPRESPPSPHQHIGSACDLILDGYQRHQEVENFLRRVCEMHENVTELFDIGSTYEGRRMLVLKIGFKKQATTPANERRKSAWIDGGIHAREHIAPSTVLYIICQVHIFIFFLKGITVNSKKITNLLTQSDWYFLPVVNPDGYEYSFTKNRMWRKNRRPTSPNCIGVDLNRNWIFGWGGADSEANPCAFNYRGEHAESEAEVINIVRFITDQQSCDSQFFSFITYHSYGQKIYTGAQHGYGDNNEATALAYEMSKSIKKVNGAHYQVGTSSALAYPFGGGSSDWAKRVVQIKYSYLIELRDRGQNGFLLTRKEIVPTGQEQWAAILKLGAAILNAQNLKKVINCTDETKLKYQYKHPKLEKLNIHIAQRHKNSWKSMISNIGSTNVKHYLTVFILFFVIIVLLS